MDDVSRESAVEEVKDLQNKCFWIPTTPVKPNLAEPKPIYADREENQQRQAKWWEAEEFSVENLLDQASQPQSQGFSAGFLHEIHTQRTAACCGVNGDNVGIFNNFSLDFLEICSELRCGDLLALATSAPSVAPFLFNSQIEGNRFRIDSVHSMSANKDLSGDSTAPHYGCSLPSGPSFDLNSPPRTATEAILSRSSCSQFQPITPDQAKREEKRHAYDVPSSSIDERAKDKPANEVASKIVLVNELHTEKEQSQLLEDRSSAAVSTQLQENHNLDNDIGVNQGTDSNKILQQKPKRRKHRPKVVIEGQPKKTPKPRTPKPADTKEVPRAKRKYVRRKGLDQPKVPSPTELTSKTTDPKADGHTTKSCRRSLNFDHENQVSDESSSCNPSANLETELHAQDFYTRIQSRSTEKLAQEMAVAAERIQVGIACELTHCMNQVPEGYLSRPKIQAPSPSTPAKTDLLHITSTLMVDTQNECIRGKCQIISSDKTHDREATVEMMTNSYPQLVPRSPNDSNCSSCTCVTNGKGIRGLKREHSCTIDEAEEYVGRFTVSEHVNDRIPSVHLPTMYKKKRTEKVHNSATSSTSSTLTATKNQEGQIAFPSNIAGSNPFTSEINCTISDPQFNSSGSPTADVSSAHDKQQTVKCMLDLGCTKKLTKKRSKGRTQVHDLALQIQICKQMPASPTAAASGLMKGFEILNHPHTCMEVQVLDKPTTMAGKKRIKRNSLDNSMPLNTYEHHRFLSNSMGPLPNILWKGMPYIDAIVEQFRHLDINADSNQVAGQEQNALVPYVIRYQGENALVLYQRDGTIVPFDGSFGSVKRRRARAKVDLDDETNRVWKLLLEDINSEGIDGTDDEKTKWWEEERKVFRGRADSFIARMHLVQGDRRFSQWKGSVVDSVVGVFLTQNVSDHLSSSAFMSLAARFPLESKSNHGSPHEDRTGVWIDEPDVCAMNPNNTIAWHEDKSNEPVCDQGSMMLQDAETNDKEVNSNQSFGSRSSSTLSTDNYETILAGSSKSGPYMYHGSAAKIPRTVANCVGDQREMDNIFSFQKSLDPSIVQTAGRIASCSQLNSETESFGYHTSFVKLLQMAGTTVLHGVHNQVSGNIMSTHVNTHSEGMACQSQELNNDQSDDTKSCAGLGMPLSDYSLHEIPNSREQGVECFDMLEEESTFSNMSKRKEENCTSQQDGLLAEHARRATIQKTTAESSQEAWQSLSKFDHTRNDKTFRSQVTVEGPNIESQTQDNKCKRPQVRDAPNFSGEILDGTESSSIIDSSRKTEQKGVESNVYHLSRTVDGINIDSSQANPGKTGKQKQDAVDWDSLRKQAQVNGKTREKTSNTMDSVDWEAVKRADVNEIAMAIRERGMNNRLGERIKDFLDRIVRDHGSIDLEWLRDVPPDKAKEYLLSIRGLGLKSVECVRLLTLHHLAFPVDTNVGRIAVRLGWVPLQPLPESLQLHLLELYPVLESIQKYLWPRLCKLDQRTLYELHYQMITFGKVFCTKSKPNCNACPMRGECRHFASAFARARLALPAPEEKSMVSAPENKADEQNPVEIINQLQLTLPQTNDKQVAQYEVSDCEPVIEEPATPGPIIEVPATPEQEQTQILESDIEDTFREDPDGIPTIKLNIEEFTQNLQTYLQKNMQLQDGDMSKALVAITSEAASIPKPKLKNVSQLRTEHQVYELPDSHPLLEGMDKREPDDPCPYLLAIWTPGETANSIEPPERWCGTQECGKLCEEKTCFSCNSIREANSQTVRGTLLIPCRTAMRGSFPLNGTYFQVNEVFADHESSLHPIDVPRNWLWNLPRRMVYFGTSIPTIFKGLSTEGIQYCFWRGFVCVRGFDQKARAPRPLIARLHFPASKLKAKGKTEEK